MHLERDFESNTMNATKSQRYTNFGSEQESGGLIAAGTPFPQNTRVLATDPGSSPHGN
jgi:hypothetical protein